MLHVTFLALLALLKPTLPREVWGPEREIKNSTSCPFGLPMNPAKLCKHQRNCQTALNINSYCSDAGVCCQEEPFGNKSLCYDRRLPLFGEDKCEKDEDCRNDGALCKSGHCCPDFHYITNVPLQPPTNFYVSNYPCIPGEPIPPGFHFAFCSNSSQRITYVGEKNKCLLGQHINLPSKCQTDFDCFPNNVCAMIGDVGTCFKDPEVCETSALYKTVWISNLIAFITMLFYFFFRSLYVNPDIWKFSFPTTSFIEDAMDVAEYSYSRQGMSEWHIQQIRERAELMAIRQDDLQMRMPAFEHVLYWCGILVDRPSEAEDSDREIRWYEVEMEKAKEAEAEAEGRVFVEEFEEDEDHDF